MVDNLGEKVDEFLLNWGHWVLLTYNSDSENCPFYGVAGCLLFRGCLSVEVNESAVGTFRIVYYIVGVCYSGVSVKRGSTVHIYYQRSRNNNFSWPTWILLSCSTSSVVIYSIAVYSALPFLLPDYVKSGRSPSSISHLWGASCTVSEQTPPCCPWWPSCAPHHALIQWCAEHQSGPG